MSKKQKITLEFKDPETLRYISEAYGFISEYRKQSNLPAISFSNWVVGMLIQGTRAIHDFANNTVKPGE